MGGSRTGPANAEVRFSDRDRGEAGLGDTMTESTAGPGPGGFRDTTPTRPDGRTGPDTAPARWLYVGAGLGLVALGIGLVAHARPGLAVLGWAIACAGSVGSIAVYTLVDVDRRSRGSYDDRPITSQIRLGVLLIGLLAVALNGYRFADWLSRSAWLHSGPS